MSLYETRAGPSPYILECFQKEYRLQISHCDFVHLLDVPSQMQPATFKPSTLNLKKNPKLGRAFVRNVQTILRKCWVSSHHVAYGPTVILAFWYLRVFASFRIWIAEVKTFFHWKLAKNKTTVIPNCFIFKQHVRTYPVQVNIKLFSASQSKFFYCRFYYCYSLKIGMYTAVISHVLCYGLTRHPSRWEGNVCREYSYRLSWNILRCKW